MVWILQSHGEVGDELMMKKNEMIFKNNIILLLLISMCFQFGCKKSPTYNPFDEEFDISVRQVIRDGCDTLSAGCNYYNLVEKNRPYIMYYQIHSSDFYDVVAKGFAYHIDTFRLGSRENFYNKREQISDSLFQLQFDIQRFNKIIEKYNYSYLEKERRTVNIINREIQDTIALKFNIAETNDPRCFVRNLEYSVGKPRLHEDFVSEE